MNKYIFLFFIFSSNFSYADPPSLVYRAVLESPEFVKQTGGFLPRGSDGTRPNQPPPDISLFNHVNGAATGLARHDSGYVSTTTSFNLAHLWVNQNLGGMGYIYFIHPTGNFIDVNQSLLRYSPQPGELEYAALGVIRWNQITGWRQVHFGTLMNFIQNRDYNPSLYLYSHAGGAQPELAGFPSNHSAWDEEPWRDFTNCGSPQIRTGNATHCTPTEDSQHEGVDYFRKSILNTMSQIVRTLGNSFSYHQ